MTLVLIGKDLVLKGSTTKIEDKQVPGIYYIYSPPSDCWLDLNGQGVATSDPQFSSDEFTLVICGIGDEKLPSSM